MIKVALAKGVSVLCGINEGKNGCQLKVERDDERKDADSQLTLWQQHTLGKCIKVFKGILLSSRRCPSSNKDD